MYFLLNYDAGTSGKIWCFGAETGSCQSVSQFKSMYIEVETQMLTVLIFFLNKFSK